ncbi:MAG: hypothetical protein HYU02_02840 [Thaumarchaeota archaeon]|nr:hypothetical protein [Nitrososphaerota archaeon]
MSSIEGKPSCAPFLGKPSKNTADPRGESLKAMIQEHYRRFDSKNLAALIEDYKQDGPKIAWRGQTILPSGNYNGTEALRILYGMLYNEVDLLKTEIRWYSATIEGNSADIQMEICFTGNQRSTALDFAATIDTKAIVVFDDGKWKISEESWNFRVVSK